MRTVRFTLEEAEESCGGRFNCGPAALAAVCSLTPHEAVEAIPGFMKRGYTNVSMMRDALHAMNIEFRRVFECPERVENTVPLYPDFGLVRIQFCGPWMRKGVPIAARYHASHWIAVDGDFRFDINAMCVGGWLPRSEFEGELIPWLIKECVPKGDGMWFPTHCWEIQR